MTNEILPPHHSEVPSVQFSVSDITERSSQKPGQPSLSTSLTDSAAAQLPNGRSVSLVDLQKPATHSPGGPPASATACLRRGSEASVCLSSPPLMVPEPAVPLLSLPARDNLPQSVPQVRRLHPGLQPLSFQNPVYQLSSSAHCLSTHSSSENLSTESSHASHSTSDSCSIQVGSTSSTVELGGRRSQQTEESATTAAGVPAAAGAPTAVAVLCQSTAAGTAHIVRVEQQSRAGGGATTPRSPSQSTSLHSSESTEVVTPGHRQQQHHTHAGENLALSKASNAPQQVRLEPQAAHGSHATGVMSHDSAQVEGVDAVMSPVERTAAWVLNNSQYEEEESRGEGRSPEKVHTPRNTHTHLSAGTRPPCTGTHPPRC